MTDKVVFITGAGNGIGEACARKLVSRGWKVSLCDMNDDAVNALAKDLGENSIACRADVRNLAELEQAMKLTNDKFGRIDAVIANAGIAHISPVATMAEEDWLRVIDINLNGVWRTFKAATPYLIESKGYALAMSSASSIVALPLSSHYTATKAAVVNLAQAYATEMKSFGVQAGSFHPSFVKTKLVNDIFNSEMGSELTNSSKILFQDYPMSWTVNGVVKSLEKRRRRAMSPAYLLPMLWFPVLINSLLNAFVWNQKIMYKVVKREIDKANQ